MSLLLTYYASEKVLFLMLGTGTGTVLDTSG